jgi:hypothetical protein
VYPSSTAATRDRKDDACEEGDGSEEELDVLLSDDSLLEGDVTKANIAVDLEGCIGGNA